MFIDMKHVTKNYQKYLYIPLHKIILVFLVRSTMLYNQIKNIIKRKKNVYIFIKSLKNDIVAADIKSLFYCTCFYTSYMLIRILQLYYFFVTYKGYLSHQF